MSTITTSGVLPVQNNNSVIPMRATNPNPLTIKTEIEQLNMLPVYKLNGYIYPTIAGNYVINDIYETPLLLPPNCFILAVGLINNTNGAAILGTSVAIQTIESTPRPLLAAVPLADINSGTIRAPLTTTLNNITGSAVGVRGVTLGTFPEKTAFLVNIFYLALE